MGNKLNRVNLFNKLASEEQAFNKVEFISPVIRGQKVRVRIAGVVMSLAVVRPEDFSGWGIFQPISFRSARWVRDPSLKEISAYLRLFPKVRLVLAFRRKRAWYGVPATESDRRFGFQQAVPVHLAEQCGRFDTAVVRFDGSQCWFESADPRRSRKIADRLRGQLQDYVELEAGDFAGCTPVETDIYETCLLQRLEHRKDSDEARIERSLLRAGAKYFSHHERGESFVVRYEVEGKSYHSTVDKGSFAIQSAGICLSGYDANFDLQSLVGVIREGRATGQIYRM